MPGRPSDCITLMFVHLWQTCSRLALVLVMWPALPPPLSLAVYQLEAPDCQGQLRPFQKPWAQTALMFLAMTACLPVAYFLEHRRQQQKQGKAGGRSEDAEEPLLESEQVRLPRSTRTA
jgi:hypothetical protein